MPATRTTRRRRRWWELPDEELLDLRVSDLGLTLEHSPLAPRVDALHEELDRRGLRFHPYVWLSTDWFTPDDTTGFAAPFYLAHPRLVRLERKQMLEVEGGSERECMQILRHEAAHAIDNAYGLRRRADWRATFGRAGEKYRSSYTPDPTSREYVLNLPYWYSQSHPLEDFAETFAVWLRPRSDWRRRYEGWPAMRKLEYVDSLMREVAARPPRHRTRRREEPVESVHRTLRSIYRAKRRIYSEESAPAFDGQLARVFPPDGGPDGIPAATFLRKNRAKLVARVSGATGQHRYLLDHVVREMITRCRAQRLRIAQDEGSALVDAAIVLTTLTSQFLFGAHPRFHR